MFLRKNPLFTFLISIVLVSTLSACSNTANDLAGASQETPDSFEGFNRKVFAFNEGVDKLIIKPAAKVYKKVTPEPIDNNIDNFFANLYDVNNAFNNILQGKFSLGINDLERFVINSTIGFGGLVDIASNSGLAKHNEDFGQTLATWGVGSGPYIVLPFYGPSTVRDGISRLTVDRATDLTNHSEHVLPLTALFTVQERADFFNEEEILNSISDDKYSALRDGWLDNRAFLIRDGEIDESAESDLIDELENLDF